METDATANKPGRPRKQLIEAGVSPLKIENPPAMLQWALKNNAPMEMLERLLALNERWEANQARKAFDAAMARVRAKLKPIEKDITTEFDAKQAGGKRTFRKHASLAAIAKSIDPILAEEGMNYSWRTHADVGQPIFVTCIISHELGHHVENTLPGPADNTGNKNMIQAVGSTITYLERYTLLAALGLSTEDADDDGAAAGSEIETISSDQIIELQKEIGEKALPKFLEKFGIKELWLLPASKYDDAKKAIATRRAEQERKAAANE
jgi:hypothetical protein